MFRKYAAPVIITILSLTVIYLMIEENIRRVDREQTERKELEKRGLVLRTHDDAICVNGWIVVSIGHGKIYARDHNFEPIPCGDTP